jgi:hypothetical protein
MTPESHCLRVELVESSKVTVESSKVTVRVRCSNLSMDHTENLSTTQSQRDIVENACESL